MAWQQGLGEKRAEFGSLCNAFRRGQRDRPQKVVHFKVQLLQIERRWRNQTVLIWSKLVACDGITFDFGSNSMIQSRMEKLHCYRMISGIIRIFNSSNTALLTKNLCVLYFPSSENSPPA
jgi:hypothetical protein